jgi:beta-glucosidase
VVGYRWYQSKGVRPLFPFGFGLSYTTFRFSNLRVQPTSAGAQVGFTITTTGDRPGAAVAQVYIGDPPAAGEPPEQLKGYRRVSLLPEQSRQVTIPLDETRFAPWDTSAQTWKAAPGAYQISVGDSSASLPLHTSIQGIARTLAPGAY